jgi:hypothetical protein
MASLLGVKFVEMGVRNYFYLLFLIFFIILLNNKEKIKYGGWDEIIYK